MSETAIYPSLQGRSVFVSGGAQGIGEAIVTEFCKQGSKVAFVDLNAEAGNKLAQKIADAGYAAPLFMECDLRNIEALKECVNSAAETNGPITILVNNAAHDERHAIDDVTPEYWDDRMHVNLRHQFFVFFSVHNMMADAGGGSIINVGSVTWLVGQGGMPGYSAAKAGVSGLTRSLAADLGPKNIRVNTVLPGWIMTDRQVELWLTHEGEADLMANQKLKRKLYPIDVAKVILFFASDDSGGCTNQSYICDGGWV